jgi:hypothetical protein
MLVPKWLAVALVVIYLWAYEASIFGTSHRLRQSSLDIFSPPCWSMDSFGAQAFKFVCPIGQFNFVQSLASPFEVRFGVPTFAPPARHLIASKVTLARVRAPAFQPAQIR